MNDKFYRDTKENDLLDLLIDKLRLKNDAALCRALEVAPPVVSKIRHGRLPVGDTILLRMHEISDIPLRKLKELLGRASLACLTK